MVCFLDSWLGLLFVCSGARSVLTARSARFSRSLDVVAVGVEETSRSGFQRKGCRYWDFHVESFSYALCVVRALESSNAFSIRNACHRKTAVCRRGHPQNFVPTKVPQKASATASWQ